MTGEMARVLLADFDGLIIDSESADATAWTEEFTRAGVPADPAEYASWWTAWGMLRLVPMIDRLAEAAPRIDRLDAESRRLARYEQLCRDLPAQPGIAAWLGQAAGAGLRVAVVTNSDPGRVAGHLDRLGLARHVEQVIGAGGVAAPKPAPDLYYQALARLGVPAEQALAVEDSPHGVLAARRAGLRVAAVPNEVSCLVGEMAVDGLVRYGAGQALERLLPGASAAVLVSSADDVPLNTVLERAWSRHAPPAGPFLPGDPAEEDPREVWAAMAEARCGHQPWHWLSSRVLDAAVAVARLDRQRGGDASIPRLPVILAALALYEAAYVWRAGDLEDVPVQLAIDLLTADEAARDIARSVPLRTSATPAGEAWTTALLPADRQALDQALDHPPSWQQLRASARAVYTRAIREVRYASPSHVLTLNGLAPHNETAIDWADHPDRSPFGDGN